MVTGLGVISPVGLDRESTWNALLAGVSGIDHIKSFDAEAHQTRIAGEIDGFEPTDYLDRKKARRMDRFAQLACVVTLEALEHGRLKMDKEDDTRVAVLIGSGVGGIQSLSEQFAVMRERGPTRVLCVRATGAFAGQEHWIDRKGPPTDVGTETILVLCQS